MKFGLLIKYFTMLISQTTYKCLSDAISAIFCGTSPVKLLLLRSNISNVARPPISLGISPLNKLLDNTLQEDTTRNQNIVMVAANVIVACKVKLEYHKLPKAVI